MMTGEGRKWLAPLLSALKGPDVYPLTIIFNSLTEYFRRSVGVWFTFKGVTDTDGRFVFDHNAPFTPSVVLITEQYDSVSVKPKDMGPLHLHSVTATQVDVHFQTANGSDRGGADIFIHVLCLP
jgi:hypothetical protein